MAEEISNYPGSHLLWADASVYRCPGSAGCCRSPQQSQKRLPVQPFVQENHPWRDNFKVTNILAASSFHWGKTTTVCMLFAIFGALKMTPLNLHILQSACRFKLIVYLNSEDMVAFSASTRHLNTLASSHCLSENYLSPYSTIPILLWNNSQFTVYLP